MLSVDSIHYNSMRLPSVSHTASIPYKWPPSLLTCVLPLGSHDTHRSCDNSKAKAVGWEDLQSGEILFGVRLSLSINVTGMAAVLCCNVMSLHHTCCQRQMYIMYPVINRSHEGQMVILKINIQNILSLHRKYLILYSTML